MALARKAPSLLTLKPDIAVVQECSKKSEGAFHSRGCSACCSVPIQTRVGSSLFGVVLVIFDLNKDAPHFSIRVRARRFSPDMFYVNEFADRLKHYDAATFEELFG